MPSEDKPKVHEGHHGACCGGHAHAHPQADAGLGQAVKDPVCGMDVDPKTAKARADYNDETYYFCSVRCREKLSTRPPR